MSSTLYEQLIQQQSAQPRVDYSSYQNPTAAALSGLTAGFERSLSNQRNLQLAQVEDSRQRALELFKSVPLTEHNFPIVMRGMMDILSAQPGKRHWSDNLGASNPQQDEVLKKIWGVVQNAMPQDANLGKTEWTPNEEGGDGGTLKETLPDPTKLQFVDQGKWQAINNVFEDEQGNKVIKFYDKDKGITKDVNLGKVKTTEDRKAETQLKLFEDKRKSDMQKPVILQMMKDTGLDYNGLVSLGPERWADEYQKATASLAAVDKEKSDVRTTAADRNRRDPGTGLTPAQTAQMAERNQRDVAELQQKLSKAESDLSQAETEYNTLLQQIKLSRGANFNPETEDPGMRFRDKYRAAKSNLDGARKLVEGYRSQIQSMKSRMPAVTNKAKSVAAPSRQGMDWDAVIRAGGAAIQGNGTNAPVYDATTPPVKK